MPSDPIQCERARVLLHDALRGGLPEALARELQEHQAGCAECRSLEAAERALSDALTRRPRHPAPASLKARLSQPPRGSARPGRWVRPPVAALAALVIAVIGATVGGAWQRAAQRGRESTDRVMLEAVNDHLRVLEGERPIEVQGGGIHQVKPWFAGRLDFAPRVTFSGDDDFPLAGGAITRFLDRKAAIFIYRRRLHTASLFVVRAEGESWPAAAEERVERGFNIVIWRQADQGYALVSDLDLAELRRLAAAVNPDK